MNFYSLFKKLAFQFDPEDVHHFTLNAAHICPQLASFLPHVNTDVRYQLTDRRLSWKFPIGMAAGLDKEAKAIDFFSRLGFGAVEIGTITPKPQLGNERPRIWRYPVESNLRNAMGFPSEGMIEAKHNLSKVSVDTSIGINLGKNKKTANSDAIQDYYTLYQNLAKFGDYIVINISSPNTPGLRDMQGKEHLNELLQELAPLRGDESLPLYVKISPDMSNEQMLEVIEVAKLNGIDGIIATNTTVGHELGRGGLSGIYLKERARNVRKYILDNLNESKLSFIGVGGISSFADIFEFWLDGGKLVQIYTSFIFQGPQILKDTQQKIDILLKHSQAKDLNELLANKNELKDLSKFI